MLLARTIIDREARTHHSLALAHLLSKEYKLKDPPEKLYNLTDLVSYFNLDVSSHSICF